MDTILAPRRKGARNRRHVSEVTVAVRESAVQAVWAALPRAAKAYRGVNAWTLNSARADGGPVLRVGELVATADQPFELIAHLQAIALQRRAVGSLASLHECEERDGPVEAEDRMMMSVLLRVLQDEKATKAERMAALDAAESAQRATAANALQTAAEIRQYRENMQANRKGAR